MYIMYIYIYIYPSFYFYFKYDFDMFVFLMFTKLQELPPLRSLSVFNGMEHSMLSGANPNTPTDSQLERLKRKGHRKNVKRAKRTPKGAKREPKEKKGAKGIQRGAKKDAKTIKWQPQIYQNASQTHQ